MKIGFDAKRAYSNFSGLGNYSRSTIELLVGHYPEHEYYLFSPRREGQSPYHAPAGCAVMNPGPFGSFSPSMWRSCFLGGDIRRAGIDLFHGLSNELPMNIRFSGARSIVTIHDLIFVRFPELYGLANAVLYKMKYRLSCDNADRIIAISRQTRNDLIELWGIPERKIDIVYQGCDKSFTATATEEGKEAVRRKYNLPEHYILSVGTVEERKNLMLTVRAMANGRIDTDLVVCGRQTPYADTVRSYAYQRGILDRIHFIQGLSFADLPAIYQMSDLFVYASIYEGFGIPILEALNSGVPVITTAGGVFGETGGDACRYIDPKDVDEMTAAITELLGDTALREKMIAKGRAHAQNFSDDKIAANIMAVYDKVMQ